MKPVISCAVFAQGGSIGIPSKEIKPLAGSALIAYCVKMPLTISDSDAMIVSNDNERIGQIAVQYMAEVSFRCLATLNTDTWPDHIDDNLR